MLTLQDDAKRIARGLAGSAFARAQQQHKVQILGLIAMSNHLHAPVRTHRKNLATFMRDAKSRITEAANLLIGKRGPLWARRYDAQAAVPSKLPRRFFMPLDCRRLPGIELISSRNSGGTPARLPPAQARHRAEA